MPPAAGRRRSALARLRARWGLPLLLGLAGACDGQHGAAQDPGPDAGPPPTFVEEGCEELSIPFPLTVRCGRVAVPERRQAAADGPPVGSRTITLRVAIVEGKPAEGAVPPSETAVYLDGVAGGSGVGNAVWYAGWATDRPLAPLLGLRRLVTIDLRGSGASRPRLACPGVAVAPLAEVDTALGFPGPALSGCRDTLVREEQAALDAYGTAAAAADVEAVRRALGLTRYDLVGSGYGARVALEVARRWPGTLRSLVLDSVTPPGADGLAEQGPAFQRALDLVLHECTADPGCAGRFPDPAGALAAVVERLRVQPVEVSTHGGSANLTAQSFTAAVESDLREGVAGLVLAERLYEAQGGALQYYAAVLGSPRAEGALGLHLSVVCAEQMAATSRAEIEARAATLSAPVRGALRARFYALGCPLWDVPAAPPSLREPVKADVPTLLLAGARDPVTPPAFAAAVAASLPRAQVVELPRQGHQVLHVPCGALTAATFLQNPAAAPAAATCAPVP